MIDTTTRYAGAAWVRGQGIPLSPFGERAADLLGWVWRGIYHIPEEVRRGEWKADEVSITLWGGKYHGLNSYDDDYLTRLLIGAHDFAIRVTVEPAGPRYLRVRLLPRQRDGAFCERHPTIERAIETARQDR